IVDEDGRLVAATQDLERISGTTTTDVRPRPADPQRDDDFDDDDDDDDSDGGRNSGESLEPGEIGQEVTFTNGSATIDGDTEDYRYAAVDVETPQGERLTVHAGGPLAAEHSAVRTARTALLIGVPLLSGLVAGVTWLVTGRALRPVAGIRREMAAITASEDLTRRVPEPDTHDEIARLARTTNETLAALEAAVERAAVLRLLSERCPDRFRGGKRSSHRASGVQALYAVSFHIRSAQEQPGHVLHPSAT